MADFFFLKLRIAIEVCCGISILTESTVVRCSLIHNSRPGTDFSFWDISAFKFLDDDVQCLFYIFIHIRPPDLRFKGIKKAQSQ